MYPDRRAGDTPIFDSARILATIYTLGYFYIVYLMMTSVLPEGNEGMLNQLIGALTIIQTTIVQYYFSGSKSAEKAQTQIADIAKAAPVVASVVAQTIPVQPAPAEQAKPVEEK